MISKLALDLSPARCYFYIVPNWSTMGITTRSPESNSIKLIEIDEKNNHVLITFLKTPGTRYVYGCDRCDFFQKRLDEAMEKNESIGKFFYSAVKDLTLIPTEDFR